MSASRRGLRRRTVCLVSHHPLVLRELGNILSRKDFLLRVQRIEPSPVLEIQAAPRASLFVVDTEMSRQAAESVIVAITERSRAARILVVSERVVDQDAFALLRLGVKGFVLYKELEDKLPLALDIVSAGGFWAPRALLSRFMDEMVASTRGRRLAGRSAVISGRERVVLESLLENLTNKEIADRLHISERTAKFHVSNLLSKFGLRRRQDLILHCLGAAGTGSPATSKDRWRYLSQNWTSHQ
jgi:DNA-binding NarL/FixJ family response regulator